MKRTSGIEKAHSQRLCETAPSTAQGKNESKKTTVSSAGGSQVRMPRSNPKEKPCLYSPGATGSGGAALRGLGSSSSLRGGRSRLRGGSSLVIEAGRSGS